MISSRISPFGNKISPGNRSGIENRPDFWWHLWDITVRTPANGTTIPFPKHLSHIYSLSIYQPICLSVGLSVLLSIYLSICLSVCLSIYLSVCLSVCLSICLSTPFIPETDPGTTICSLATVSFFNHIASPPPVTRPVWVKPDRWRHCAPFGSSGCGGNQMDVPMVELDGRFHLESGRTWWDMIFWKVLILNLKKFVSINLTRFLFVGSYSLPTKQNGKKWLWISHLNCLALTSFGV